MNMHNLTGKNIIITGASSGLGQAACIILSKFGAKICLIGRNEENLKKTFAMMEGDGHFICPMNLCDYSKYQDIFSNIISHFGVLNGLVHFAGIRKTVPLKVMKPDQVKEIFEINFFSFLELVKFFTMKSYIAPIGGSIVAVSSVAALRGAAGLVGYSSSKAALDGAVKSLACEFAKRQIRINSIAPGYIETPMNLEAQKTLPAEAYNKIIDNHPLGIGKPDDVAYLVAFLLSDESKWITGATIPIDGGFSIRS